jgi:arylsulfatase A-like enzyme
MRKNYDLVDEHLGWLLDHATDENTTILLVSDHGSVGSNEKVNPWDIMERAGLMSYLDHSESRMFLKSHVDWENSRVYPVGSCYINVNLKGREPCGIVDPEDYDKTVTEIITALQQYGRTEDGSTVSLAFAVEKEQAGFIGHGGENCGDVVYGLAGGTMGGVIGGVHSQQIPSARSKTGDIRSLCLFSGPNIRHGISLSRPADLTDLAPTLCYALEYPQPRDATGGVIFQVFED